MELDVKGYDELMMAQQPIFDRQKKLFGYELLFRGDQESVAIFDNHEVATSQVIVNLCIGISKLEAQTRQPFFINMTTELVLSDAFFPISPDTVYIEILEDQKITPDFVAAVKRWHEKGFRFVLDDYHFTPSYDPLLPFMSMVKVDVLNTPPYTVIDEIESLKRSGIELVAEKIETEVMFEHCVELGFHYFQGYYLKRPEIIKGKKIDSDVQGALKIVNALQSTSITIDQVADLVGQNPTISYQMLRLLNSPVVGLNRKVESIKEAVVYLGLAQIKRWAMLITLSSQRSSNPEMLRVLLIRAKCCEHLASKANMICLEQAFTVGLVSGLDQLLQISRKELLSQITLSDDIQKAILEFGGPLGRILFSVTSIEDENWDSISKLPVKVRASVNEAFFESLKWVNQITGAIK
ncbi:EAL and HDOD domain-containing protein [Marinomonas ostreistagni]|uniref:HDOD domain-containing protein n=1 Tax=Marinomonas ostreistagni TaxID=359209 RepID=A0ABS0Z8K1_9GAMM|nr:HDOD domain-containing protein [Marinomonas ostreistagni]MBJ7549987.1 HDOD domain-containing protein [Marinomonas ostreistagni]